MSEKLQQHINTTMGDIEKILLGDRPTTHGDIADFAATFGAMHSAYLDGAARAGRPLNALDSYAVQIIQKLARLANSAPEHAEPHLIDIVGYSVAGTAHSRAATEAFDMAAKAAAETPTDLGDDFETWQAPDPVTHGLTIIIPQNGDVPPETPIGTHVYAERFGGTREPAYLGVWRGPVLGLSLPKPAEPAEPAPEPLEALDAAMEPAPEPLVVFDDQEYPRRGIPGQEVLNSAGHRVGVFRDSDGVFLKAKRH